MEQAANEMAYSGNLKSDALPKEFDGIQPAFVTRILPYKSRPIPTLKNKNTSDSDPTAVCGYAVSDTIGEGKDFSNGIEIYIYDWGGKHHLMQGNNIPMSIFKKDEYVLYKAGVTTIPADSSLIIDERWGTPLAQHFLNRCHKPAYPDRKYEIWLSIKGQGPKFFSDDTRENRLFIEQIFVVEIAGS